MKFQLLVETRTYLLCKQVSMKFFSSAQKKFNCHAISPDQRKEWEGCVQKAIVSQMHTYLTICDQKSEIIQIKYKNKYLITYNIS